MVQESSCKFLALSSQFLKMIIIIKVVYRKCERRYNFCFYIIMIIYLNLKLHVLTRYSLLNSCSANDSLLSSQLNSKAVSIGSLLDRAIRDGLKSK